MVCKTQDSLCSNDKMLHGILAEPGSLNSKHLSLQHLEQKLQDQASSLHASLISIEDEMWLFGQVITLK